MEIELKFLINKNHIEQFIEVITTAPFEIEAKPPKRLINAYYDTPKYALRDWDMGLRTRTSITSSNSQSVEQTVKLAGVDIAGLQQRPEYTVQLTSEDNNFVDLHRFEPTIWPSKFPVKKIQKKLITLFTTDFDRHTWIITLADGSQVECVFDKGKVISGEKASDICEVELELMSGGIDSLFYLGHYLSSKLPIKLGFFSKAARGYQLLSDSSLECKNLDVIHFNKTDSVESVFIRLLSEAINFIQYHEAVLSESSSVKSLRRILDGISLIIHILELFSTCLVNTKCADFISSFSKLRRQNLWVESFYQLEQLSTRHSPYRKDIEASKELKEKLRAKKTPNNKMNQAQKQFYKIEFNRLLLNFTQWLTQTQWRQEMALADIVQLSQPIQQFSGACLQQSRTSLFGLLSDTNIRLETDQINAIHNALVSELLTSLCFGSLYSKTAWQQDRDQLLDFFIGIEERKLLSYLSNILQDKQPTSEFAWLQSKTESLDTALQASVAGLLKMKPYWQA